MILNTKSERIQGECEVAKMESELEMNEGVNAN